MADSSETAKSVNATDEKTVDRREALKTVVRTSVYAAPIATVMLTKTKGAAAQELELEEIGDEDGGTGD